MKRLTPLFILSFILLPFFIACTQQHQKEIKGNYEIIHEKINISDYDEIQLGIPAEVIYEQISYENPFLQITVDKNILSSLDISVKNNRLIITQNNDSILKPSQLKIFTNSKNIKKINIEQSGNLIMRKKVNAKNMEIAISGAGNLKADSLFCETIKINVIDTGIADIAGAATNAAFTAKNTGKINAKDYVVENTTYTTTEAGEIKATE